MFYHSNNSQILIKKSNNFDIMISSMLYYTLFENVYLSNNVETI